MKATYQYGVSAENIVILDYERRGYKILKHRYKTKHGEIDIIAVSDTALAFIEVKARTNPMHEEFVTPKQVRRCCDTASEFLAGHEEYNNLDMRFDLAVVVNGSLSGVVENAWSCES